MSDPSHRNHPADGSAPAGQPSPTASNGKTAALRRGVAQSMSIALSTGLLGLAYGASAKSIGMSLGESVLASALIFTGAAQFAVLPLMEAAAAPLAVGLVAALVSLRLFLMAGSLGSGFRSLPVVPQIAALPLISDGSWTVAMGEPDPRARYLAFVAAGLWIVSNWTVGTALGHAGAAWLPLAMLDALRASGTVFLAILLVAITRTVAASRVGHWLVAGLVSAAVSLAVPLSWAFLIGFAAGSVMVLVRTAVQKSATVAAG